MELTVRTRKPLTRLPVDQSSSNFDSHRLLQLIGEKCNGTLTSDGYEELEAVLAASSEARAIYWDAIAVHADLDWELAGKEVYRDELARLVLETTVTDKRTLGHVPLGTFATWGPVVAVCLFVGALFGAWRIWQADANHARVALEHPHQDVPAEPAILGRLSPLVPESHWSFGRTGDRNPTGFRTGDTVWLNRGAAELRLTSNTVAVLESPVILQIVSIDRVRVLRGRIKVDVPKGSEGFTVETAAAEVIDLGTSFSVNVAKNNTEVVVYQGEVDLKVSEQSVDGNRNVNAAAKRFRMGEAVRVGSDGTLSRIVNVQQSAFPLGRVVPNRRPVITLVKDNVVRDDLWSFYEVVWGGMEDDARAFVDRRHEWNGATIDGMPAYLIGGDYVKTFNNDKVADDLTIEVTMNRPADVYVLLDKRVVPPDWLVESFTDTGDEIGVDEAWHDPLNFTPGLEDFAQIGPGKSIERTHSIWRSNVIRDGVVTLGPNGRLPGEEKWRSIRAGTNMYGIVAVPLDTASQP